MAEPIKITITNLPQIKRAFNKAPKLMTKELNTAIAKSVLLIKRDSMKNTPVLTGLLRASHETTFENLKGSVFTTRNYDIFVHEGTRYMKARPYMRDAVEGDALAIDGFFTQAVDKVLHQIGAET
jgi:hypothetical protein